MIWFLVVDSLVQVREGLADDSFQHFFGLFLFVGYQFGENASRRNRIVDCYNKILPSINFFGAVSQHLVQFMNKK